jgi:hypothetical protein
MGDVNYAKEVNNVTIIDIDDVIKREIMIIQEQHNKTAKRWKFMQRKMMILCEIV